MRVAIVHDDLVQWGGAERGLEGICELFPDAPIFTTVFDRSNKELNKRFGGKNVITSFLQKIPGWRNFYKQMFLFYPIALEQFRFDRYNLVISQSTRYAHCIITKPNTRHICYMHTPPRFLWNFSLQQQPYLSKPFLPYLRLYDRVISSRTDLFLAGSKNAKARIKKIYSRNSEVLYPFVDLSRFNHIKSFDGGYLVVISRLNAYKRVDLVIEACKKIGISLKIIGSGPQIQNLKKIAGEKNNIDFYEGLNDRDVSYILAGARALVLPGIEDFGLTPIEAQALGKAVVAFRSGGALETVIEEETGIFFDNPTVESLSDAILKLDKLKIDPQKCKMNARRFSKEAFIKNFRQAIASL